MTQRPLVFDPAESIRRRDRGIARASSRHAIWLAEAREVAVRIALRDGQVSADSLRAEGIETPAGASPNIWGSIFVDPRFEFMGYTKSARPVAHRNLLRVWRVRS